MTKPRLAGKHQEQAAEHSSNRILGLLDCSRGSAGLGAPCAALRLAASAYVIAEARLTCATARPRSMERFFR